MYVLVRPAINMVNINILQNPEYNKLAKVVCLHFILLGAYFTNKYPVELSLGQHYIPNVARLKTNNNTSEVAASIFFYPRQGY